MNQPNITVLAVDDSQDILFALSAICELEGWRTLTTTEGSEAIELVKQSRPDIVLVDYHMPRMDGIEVVRNIRAADPAIPIVVLTIEGSRAVADSFLAAGADDSRSSRLSRSISFHASGFICVRQGGQRLPRLRPKREISPPREARRRYPTNMSRGSARSPCRSSAIFCGSKRNF